MADTCRCDEADADACNGGGIRPRMNGTCGCPCHGGAEATDALASDTFSAKLRELQAMSQDQLVVEVLALRSTCAMYAQMHTENAVSHHAALLRAQKAERDLGMLRSVVEEFVVAERELSQYPPYIRTGTHEGRVATRRAMMARVVLGETVPDTSAPVDSYKPSSD